MILERASESLFNLIIKRVDTVFSFVLNRKSKVDFDMKEDMAVHTACWKQLASLHVLLSWKFSDASCPFFPHPRSVSTFYTVFKGLGKFSYACHPKCMSVHGYLIYLPMDHPKSVKNHIKFFTKYEELKEHEISWYLKFITKKRTIFFNALYLGTTE